MVKEYTNKSFNYREIGYIDFTPIVNNFDNIEEVINDHAKEIKDLMQRQTASITWAIKPKTFKEEHIIVEGRKHIRFKIKNAFVIPADDSGREIDIEISGITNKIKLKDSFNAGKVELFDIENDKVMFHKDIKVITYGSRPFIIGLTYESYEEEE